MMLLPIVTRELRVATRKRATYWSRIIAALIAVGLVVWMLGTLGTLVSADLLGARMFKVLAHVAFYCSLIPGVILTADCISEERRDGTLGLLFLTNLKGYDIILAKLIATSLRAFYGLLAVFPLLAISFFVGGVTFGEFWRMLAALINAMWFSLTAGMFVSSFSSRVQRAMLGTALLILGATFILPAVLPVAVFSPETAFRLAFASTFVAKPGLFGVSLIIVHLTGWVLLGAASRLVSKRVTVAPVTKAFNWRPVRVAESETPPAERLACHELHQGWLWLSLLLPLAVWGAGMISGRTWWNPFALFTVLFALHLLLQFWLTWEASRRLSEARRSGILEMLLSTPLPDRQIVHGQAVSLERQFGVPVFCVLALDTVLVILGRTHFKWPEGEAFEFFTMTAGMIFAAVVNTYAVAWVGLWEGLKGRRAGTAALRALLRVVVLPMAFFMVPLCVLINSAGGSGTGLLSGSGTIWAAVVTINAAFFSAMARHHLHWEFRLRAAGDVPLPSLWYDPPEPPAPPPLSAPATA